MFWNIPNWTCHPLGEIFLFLKHRASNEVLLPLSCYCAEFVHNISEPKEFPLSSTYVEDSSTFLHGFSKYLAFFLLGLKPSHTEKGLWIQINRWKGNLQIVGQNQGTGPTEESTRLLNTNYRQAARCYQSGRGRLIIVVGAEQRQEVQSRSRDTRNFQNKTGNNRETCKNSTGSKPRHKVQTLTETSSSLEDHQTQQLCTVTKLIPDVKNSWPADTFATPDRWFRPHREWHPPPPVMLDNKFDAPYGGGDCDCKHSSPKWSEQVARHIGPLVTLCARNQFSNFFFNCLGVLYILASNQRYLGVGGQLSPPPYEALASIE